MDGCYIGFIMVFNACITASFALNKCQCAIPSTNCPCSVMRGPSIMIMVSYERRENLNYWVMYPKTWVSFFQGHPVYCFAIWKISLFETFLNNNNLWFWCLKNRSNFSYHLINIFVCVCIFWSCSIALGCVAMVPIIIYPLMKRITHWPQVFLGKSFSSLWY